MCLPLSRLNGHWMVNEIRLKTTFPFIIHSPFSHHSITIQSIERWDFILWLLHSLCFKHRKILYYVSFKITQRTVSRKKKVRENPRKILIRKKNPRNKESVFKHKWFVLDHFVISQRGNNFYLRITSKVISSFVNINSGRFKQRVVWTLRLKAR